MDDDLDLDSVLFGSSDPPAYGSFDPFLPGLIQQGGEDTGDDAESDGRFGSSYEDELHDAHDDATSNIVGHSRFSDQGYRIHQQDDDGPLPWQRAGDIRVLGEEERRAREAADTGTRNVRRTAEEHAGSVNTGRTRIRASVNEPNVASSISAAAERIRADIRVPLDTRERSAAIIRWEQTGGGNGPGGGKVKRQYVRDDPAAPVQFISADFECMLTGLKANASGDWILMVRIPSDNSQGVFPLNSAFGLALDVHVQRRKYKSDDVST